MAEYKPGVCNIGKNEIRKRYAFGAAGFVIAAIISYVVFLLNLSHWALAFVFIALIMGFEGIFQGYFRFCAGFAAAGKYDLTGSGDSKGQVTDPGFHKKDMKKATDIHAYSIISAIILLAIIYLVLLR